MDVSRRDLQQLFIRAKSNTAIDRQVLEWLKNIDGNIDLLTKEGFSERDFDIAFTSLLSSYHATESSIEKFLNLRKHNKEQFVKKAGNLQYDDLEMHTIIQGACQDSEMKVSFSLSNFLSTGITALHIAIYRNSLHVDKIAKLLLSLDRPIDELRITHKHIRGISMASIPMVCGSYPLHILTGQNLTINERLLETLLHADSSIPFREDINGDNPISLLWKNTLRFRWAISVMEGATSIDYIKNNDCSWMAVITPYQFIDFALWMGGTALQKLEKSEITFRPLVRTIHDLCRIPRCPPMLLQLLQSPEYKDLYKFGGTARTIDEHGMLPIHYAVQNPPVTYKFVPSSIETIRHKSLVEILLEQNPGGVKIADKQGRLPLHHALDSGCLSGRDVLKLVELYPDSLRVQDPMTGLLPFMLVSKIQRNVSICNTLHNTVCRRDAQKPLRLWNKKSVRMENELSFTEKTYQADWKKDHVKMSYSLLMLCPDAISFRTPTGRNEKGNRKMDPI